MENPPQEPLQIPSCAQALGVGIQDIPEILFEMEDDLGEPVTAAFLRRFAGREVYPPKRPPAGCGEEVQSALMWLHQRVGNGKLVIPMGPASALAVTRWNAFLMFKRGLSNSAVARRLGCHVRTAMRHRSELVKMGALAAYSSAGPQDARFSKGGK